MLPNLTKQFYVWSRWLRLKSIYLIKKKRWWVFNLVFSLLKGQVLLDSLSSLESEVAQSCLTLYDPMDCSLPGSSSIHGIFQARILEWVAIFFSRGSAWPRDRTQVSHIAGRLFTLWATRESLSSLSKTLKKAFLYLLK